MLPAVLNRIFDRKAFGSVAVLASGTAIGQAIVILCSPILTRIYTPADLGILTVFMSVVSLVGVIVSLRYEFAIPLPEDERIAASVFAICMVCTVSISVVSGLAIWLSGAWIASYIPLEALVPFLWFVPIALLGSGLYGAMSSWTIRTQGFRYLASTRPAQRAGQSLATIGLGLLGFGPLGLLIGDVVGRCVAVLPLARHCWSRGLSTSLPVLTIAEIRHSAHRYRRFPVLSSWAALLNAAGTWLPMMFMAAFYSLQVAGWLALAQRVLGIPLTLFSASVANVYFSDCARAHHVDPADVSRLFWSTMWRQLVIAVSILVFLVLPAPYMFALLFGRDWAEAGWYLVALSPMFVSQFVACPLGATLDVLERQDLHILRELIRFTLLSAAILYSISFSHRPFVTIVFFSIEASLSHVIGIFLASYATGACKSYVEA
jgi:O-antigen/teichoic acid export membrane protein